MQPRTCILSAFTLTTAMALGPPPWLRIFRKKGRLAAHTAGSGTCEG